MISVNMNPNINVNLQTNPSQVSVINLEDIPQVGPLHILENEISPEMLSHVYITDPFPLLIGSERAVISVENQIKPATINEADAKPYPQVGNLLLESNLHTVTDKAHAQIKSLVFPNAQKTNQYYKTKPFNDVIPNSSKRYAINDQIELMHSFSYAYKSLPTKSENFQTKQSLNTIKPNSNSSEPHPPSFINSQSDIRNFLRQPLDALTQNPLEVQINSQPLNYAYKPSVKTNTDPEMSAIDINGQSNKHQKRKVQNYVHISDVRVPQRAVAVLPTALQLRGKDNIFPRRTLPARIRFGPVEGIHKVITPAQALGLVSKSDAPVFLMTRDDEIIHIDVSDKDKCNWMGLLPLGGEANVWLYQDIDELYAITTEPINARRPLQLGYSKKYAEDHKLPPGVPTLDLEIVLSSNPKRWWCNECNRALPSASLLQRHADVYHKDDIISTRRGYRCLKCRRTFSRLYTLRRHISKHCVNSTEKPTDTTEPNAPLDLNSLNEDNRIPSDESFQNFTNGLDFSTSLFDTDRISNLDISGNSRTDGDFNPYDITFRDDTSTSNELSFTKLTSGPSNIIKNELKKDGVTEALTNCNQTIKKDSKRKHISECPSRRLECACGRSFRNDQKLTQHFIKEHQADADSKTKPEKKKYTCEQCKTKRVCFKRRGMLVNHLWRAHRIVSTSKVERPVRHYPCGACSKIYRSAAKRDRHIDVHHPGAEKLILQSIEGGVKSCEPAACSECPRQYATRAKLLQHVRAQHPHAVNKEKTLKKTLLQSTATHKDKLQYTASQQSTLINPLGLVLF